MPRGKGQTSTNGFRWTDEMDQVLLNSFTEELMKGNRHDGSWTSEAYSNVTKVLQEAVSPSMTKQHIKSRMKTLKEHFAESYDLFNSLSGFAWNPMTKRFEAEDDVWEDFIKDKPHAIKWKTMQIKHYDTLKELFGADRATGRRASTARQRAPQMQSDNDAANDAQDDISLSDPVVGEMDEGQFSPPNLDSFSPAYAQSHQSTGTSSSRGTKRKAQLIDLVEGQLEKMSNGLGLVADALNKGNCISDKLHDVADRQVVIAERQVTAVEKRNEIFQNQLNIIQHTRLRVYNEAEVCDLLSELNVVDPYRMQCYEFLCNNEQKKRQLFGVPFHMRMQALIHMMNPSG